MSEPTFPALPADLAARLEAAGATDDASIQRALDADPELKRDLEACFAASQAQANQTQMQQLLSAFLAVPNSNALVEFWVFFAFLNARSFEELRQTAEQTQLAQQFQQALDRYLELCQAAEQGERDGGAWQAAIEAGEALLAPEFTETPGLIGMN